jgi:NADP-dependent 3-hydroxy acid dehydrogenase YdfG
MERAVLVTGVGPRLGDALCRAFAREGWQVGLLARSTDHTEPLAEELAAETPGEALAVTGDVTDPESVARAVDAVREAFGPVEVLVHNASAPGGSPVEEATAVSMHETWAVRAGGLQTCLRACLDDLRATEGALLVSGTTYASDPDPGQLEWASAAAATRGLVRALRDEPFRATYVAIGSAVAPPESEWGGALSADALAERFVGLVDGPAVTELEVRAQ